MVAPWPDWPVAMGLCLKKLYSDFELSKGPCKVGGGGGGGGGEVHPLMINPCNFFFGGGGGMWYKVPILALECKPSVHTQQTQLFRMHS